MSDIEESITASDALRARREEWERGELLALAERRARKLPITEEEIERDLERRLMASAPLVNARAAEVRARQERIKTHKPRSIAPPPVAPRVVEPPAPPRKVAPTKKPAPAPKPAAALGDGPAAVVQSPAPAAPRVERPRPAPAQPAPPPARKPAAKMPRPSVGERQAAAGAERRARIIELTAQGKTARQIARLMDLSQQSVRGHLRAAGLAPEPPKKGSDADWPALYREGKTIKEIADLSGWSTTHVRQKLAEAGVEMRLAGAQEMLVKAAVAAAATDISHISTAERDAVRKLAADGVPVRILASNYGYKHSEIRAMIAQPQEVTC
jgi:DNA-binding transcriptional ArsR family regulator